MNDIILIGGGGHCKSVIDTIRSQDEYNILGIIDIEKKVGSRLLGIEVIGTDSDLDKFYHEGINTAFITLGSIGQPTKRVEIFNKLKKIGFKLPVIMDKSAIISDNVSIGEGCFIGKGVIINVDAEIGSCCILNTGAQIDHDCKIGDFVHIAPGTVLSGGVKIKEESHIGTNSTIIENTIIGKCCLIGAGSVVVNEVKDNTLAYGNPCREVSRNE